MFERIDFEGLANTRDLAGIPVGYERQIKPRCLLRSSALAYATPNDLDRLVCEYNVRTIVDFRTPEEIEEKPDPELPGVRNVAAPVLRFSSMGVTHENNLHGGGGLNIGKQLRAMLSKDFSPDVYMIEFYRNAVTMDSAIEQYRRFFELLLEQEEGAVLWHCSMGKDRAGIGTALVLLALGASTDTIIADYLITNTYVAKSNRADAARYARMAPFFLRPILRRKLIQLFSAKASYLECALSAMEQKCGSIDAYLAQELGLGVDERTRLKELYTCTSTR